MGPLAYLQHLVSTPRLPFTAAYFGSLGLTLYFSIGVRQPSLRGRHEDANIVLASKHDSHSVLGPYPTGLSHLVSSELLPHGLQRVAPCEQLRCSQGRRLDDWLNRKERYQVPPYFSTLTPPLWRCVFCNIHVSSSPGVCSSASGTADVGNFAAEMERTRQWFAETGSLMPQPCLGFRQPLWRCTSAQR